MRFGFLPLILFLIATCRPALAGERVPDVSPQDLPVAGTCAPIPTSNATWVTVGEPGWYRVDAEVRDLDEKTLAGILRERARVAAETGTPHDVWILAPKDHWWGHVVPVLHACQFVGLHRVGLQVRSESGDGLKGFPLFLPYRAKAVDGPPGLGRTARGLEVRLETTADEPSYAPRLFAAASRAVERFGPVVAEVSIETKTKVQDAVTVVDLLYRAGCAAVKLKYRLMVRHTGGPSIPQIWVQERLLEAEAIPVDIPPIRPRKMPWPDDGAAQPGAYGFQLEPLPKGEGPDPTRDVTRRPLPSYAARGSEVPASARLESERAVKEWADTLGAWLARILSERVVHNVPETLLVKRRRQGLGAEQFFSEARRTFPGPDHVTPATLRIQAYLFRGTRVVGKVDATLNLAGSALDVVYANWVVEQFPEDLILPPVETGPFAAGVPGHLRVWVEGLLAATRVRGPTAVPMASERDVLAHLPTVAHRPTQGGLARRGAGIENLAGWLRATPYDRVFIASVDGQAAVHEGGRVVGVLRFALESEGGYLSLASLKSKVAPR